MSYELEFKTSALKEWNKLGASLRGQFKKKLAERLDAPHVPAAKLRGSTGRYKIKLRNAGYRLVYEVEEARLVVVVVAVDKRARGGVYRKAEGR
ncbi:type II toxin-antitoxin system RelE/ParE family toxin [Rhodobacteraceae bacterium 63075]|nr:type II toxin-antitoxin system RelE/ParE family toxin [Rhodobacteraceae bacterium 63075]